MTDTSHRRVLIIGGHFAGLSAAIALRRVGIEVAVFERANVLRGIEAGVVLQITAMKALKKMGLLEQVQAISGTPIEALELKSSQGRLRATIPQSRLGIELGVPGSVVHRGEFLDVLKRQLADTGIVQLNRQCTDFQQDEEGVTAYFEDGGEERGSVLLGADGIHSVIRKQLSGEGDESLRYSGFTAWRAMPVFSSAVVNPAILQQASDHGQIFGLYPARNRLYWFAGKRTAAGGGDAPEGRKQELLSLFRGWFEPIEAVIEATEESSILRNDVYDRVPAHHWGNGRVTLAGDAAHPTTPTLGQGAGMAIEDAVVLAKELALAGDIRNYAAVENALRAYERNRIPRTTFIVNESWQISKLVMETSPIRGRIQDAFLRLTPARVWQKRGEADAVYEA